MRRSSSFMRLSDYPGLKRLAKGEQAPTVSEKSATELERKIRNWKRVSREMSSRRRVR